MKAIKRFFFFALLTGAFCLMAMYLTEKTDPLSLGAVDIEPNFKETDGRQILSWKKLPYPCQYEVETYCEPTGLFAKAKERLIKKELTADANCPLLPTAVPTNYRITAYGLFGRVAGPFVPVANPHFQKPFVPLPISSYSAKNPASLKPFLIWHTIPTAACYELELLSAPPALEGGINLDRRHSLFSTQKIFTNGCQVDLTPYQNQAKIYWRVRALDLAKKPLGEFSHSSLIALDEKLAVPDQPQLNDYDVMPEGSMPAYPVYHWIPIDQEGLRYEVELTASPAPYGYEKKPQENVIWRKATPGLFALYDDDSRLRPGTYYWRVRAIDGYGNTVGRYSATSSFTVPDYEERPLAAAFGDSITHGGGAVSYSPANLEYSYTSYLDFPAINLGKSGDTISGGLDRFATDVLPLRPKNLLILTGTNNLRSWWSAADMIADFDRLRKRCEDNGIRPIFMTLLPLNPEKIANTFFVGTTRNWQNKLAIVNRHLRSMPYCIDLEPYFYDEKHEVLSQELATDGLHPDVRGKMLMAEIINAHKDMLQK